MAGTYRSRPSPSDGQGEEQMHRYLTKDGLDFERQFKVDRWRIDMARYPVALEIERGWFMPHEHEWQPIEFPEGKKYRRLLTLIDRGWHIMAMRPPYVYGWGEAVQLVREYVDAVEAGSAPPYVCLRQKNNDGDWLRLEGTYSEGKLTVTEVDQVQPPRTEERKRLWSKKETAAERRAREDATIRASIVGKSYSRDA
jgi:hypothetical protein